MNTVTKVKSLLLALLVLTVSATLLPARAQLSGTYTIGGADPDYATFNAAVTDLVAQGVSGPVAFDVRTGTYTEQVTISEIAGTSAVNTVTFRSESGQAADVILRHNATSTATDWVIQLNGADHVTFRDLTLSALHASRVCVLDLRNDADHNSLIANVINSNNGGSSAKGAVHSTDATVDHLLIQDNSFTQSGYSISMRGTSAGFVGTRIIGNTFTSPHQSAVYLDYHTAPVLQNNVVTGAPSSHGFSLRYAQGATEITGNRVVLTSLNAYGVFLRDSEATSDERGLIANNHLEITAGSASNGFAALRLLDTRYHDVVYNTLVVTGTTTVTEYYAASLLNAENVTFENNVVAAIGAGARAIRFNSMTRASIQSDYNVFYAVGPYVAKEGEAEQDFKTFETWQAFTGKDANSAFYFPAFLADGFPHTRSRWLNGRGTPQARVTTDMDGDPRDPATPDPGADEFTPLGAPLSGTYTIGGGNYATWAEALADLHGRGVSGPVRFEVASGTYSGLIPLWDVPGASETNTVTFVSASGMAEDVTLRTSGTDPALRLNGTDHVRFEQMRFDKPAGAESATVVNLRGRLSDVQFSGNVFTLAQNGTGLSTGIADVQGGLVIRDNDFAGTSTSATGISLMALNGFIGSFGATLEGNTFSGLLSPVRVRYIAAPLLITDNHIVSTTAGTGISVEPMPEGIVTGGAVVSGNRINYTGNGAMVGIRVWSNAGSDDDPIRVVNNTVRIGGTGGTDPRGIYLDGVVAHVQVAHNTVLMEVASATSRSLDLGFPSSGVEVVNNVLHNAGGGWALYAPSNQAETIVASDYNNLVSNGPVAYWKGSSYMDLAAYQAASGKDASSTTVAVTFADAEAGDLHLSGSSVGDAALVGTGFESVTHDVDGQRRSRFSPYKGADEVAQVVQQKTVSGDGEVPFEGTAVRIMFTGTDGSSGEVVVRREFSSPQNVEGIGESNVSPFRWVIEEDPTLTFGDLTEIRFALDALPVEIEQPNSIVIYKRETEGSGSFTALPTSYDPDTRELVVQVDGFSEFVMGSDAEALPVELVSFDALLSGSDVLLRWQTASETNNAGFSVERKATSEERWNEVAFVGGHGTTTEAQAYAYTVTGLVPGLHRFRLKQVDYDGQFAYSPEVEVAIDVPGGFLLTSPYPNPAPAAASVTLTLVVAQTQPVRVAVYDVLGREVAVLHEGVLPAHEQRVLTFPASLSAGLYFVRAHGEGESQTRRLVLVH